MQVKALFFIFSLKNLSDICYPKVNPHQCSFTSFNLLCFSQKCYSTQAVSNPQGGSSSSLCCRFLRLIKLDTDKQGLQAGPYFSPKWDWIFQATHYIIMTKKRYLVFRINDGKWKDGILHLSSPTQTAVNTAMLTCLVWVRIISPLKSVLLN